jgi:hypothetical protein
LNSGAIKFSESAWLSMEPNRSVDIMCWLNDNLEPGYQVIKLASGIAYFVGDSDILFLNHSANEEYDVYNIKIKDDKFCTELEQFTKLCL